MLIIGFQATSGQEPPDKVRHHPQSSTFLPPHLYLALSLHMAGLLRVLPVRREVRQVYCRLRMDLRLGRLHNYGAISYMAYYQMER